MNLEAFKKSPSGRIRHMQTGYRAFVPNPLPPDLAWSSRLVQALSQADRALGELAGLGNALPNPYLLVRPFVRREAVLSSRIEGTRLQRFENMSREEIQQVAVEIALLGASGLDYASLDKKYSLNSLPGEQFSGLQLMYLMYVGFKDVDPTLDLGIDLSHAYEAALKMHTP